jgi:hypothetical protein
MDMTDEQLQTLKEWVAVQVKLQMLKTSYETEEFLEMQAKRLDDDLRRIFRCYIDEPSTPRIRNDKCKL